MKNNFIPLTKLKQIELRKPLVSPMNQMKANCTSPIMYQSMYRQSYDVKSGKNTART